MGQDDAKVPTEMSDADEEAIRAKLREAGWDKNKILTKSKSSVAATGDEQEAAGKRTESDDKSHEKKRSGRDKDKEKDRSGRTEKRRSRSVRRRDKDRSDRRRDRERDRGARRRRASRSRSVSKSRSRSASARRRGKEKDRSGKRRSRSLSAASRSRSPSRGGSKRSRRGDTKDVKKPSAGEDTANGENGKEKKANAPAESTATNGNAKPADEAQDETKKAGSDDRKSRKSSRHRSRSASRSPSRSRRRRRRHRSPSRSRSASHGRGGRGGRRGSSRSRSRSHSRRRRSSRRRSSRSRSRSRGRGHSRSRSRSYSRRRRRSSSRDRSRSRRDANSSPQPHQFPPTTDAGSAAVVNPLNPSIAQLMQQYPTMSLQDIIAKMQASNVTMAAAVSMKPARELYVGNLPASVTGPQLQEFLGTIIQQVGLTVQPGNPILSTWISTDGHFAFCEMRSIEECNMALMLNQLPLLGQPLKFGRPKSFMGPPQPMPVLPPRTQTALSNLGCTPNTAWFATPATDVSSVAAMTASMSVAPSMAPLGMGAPIAPFSAPAPIPMAATLSEETSSNKLIMSNIPVVLTEDQVKELVEPFGELKSFALVNDPVTQQPTGSALFEYVDESVTEDAKNGLDGLDLGGIPLAVRRANASEETGPVLRLANMVSIDELKDDEEFADLKEDVEEECKRFGQVVALEIPRPNDGEMVAGLGDIFVQFETPNEAAAALKALSGRKFGGNIVKVSYFPLAKLQQKDFA